MTDQIKLTYHGNTYTAVRCGRTIPTGRGHAKTLYWLAMKSSAVIAFDGGDGKARGWVLNATTSAGTKLENLESIEWDGPGSTAAREWAAEQCELAAKFCDEKARWFRSSPEGQEKLKQRAAAYRAMAADLREP